MKSNRRKSGERPFGSLLYLGSIALALSACAVSEPLTLESSVGEASSPAMVVALAQPDDEAPAITRRFAASLTEALKARQIAVSDEGNLIADFAASNGPAQLGVGTQGNSSAGQQGSTQDTTQWISQARPSRRFDECEARELRGTFLLLDKATGGVVYRGQAAMIECDFGDAQINEVAQALVSDWLATQR